MIVTIFRNRLKPEHQVEYYPYAKEIHELAVAMPGFMGQKSFMAEDGERVSIVEFASEDTHQAWREHPGHRVPKGLDGANSILNTTSKSARWSETTATRSLRVSSRDRQNRACHAIPITCAGCGE